MKKESSPLSLFLTTSDYKNELIAIKDELAIVEIQLADLLERQGDLIKREQELEDIVKQNASTSTVSDKKWDTTGMLWF